MSTSRGGRFAGVAVPSEAVSLSRLWWAAIATFVVGDVVTTTLVLSLSDVHTEANPLVAAVLRVAGTGGLVGLKALFVLVCLGATVPLRDHLRDPLVYAPPVVIGLVGLYATLHNAGILVSIL